MKKYGYMIFYDDDDSLCMPMGWDTGCSGAVTTDANPPVVFPTRADARAAIKISRAFALAQKACGKVYYGDFIECYKHVKIKRVELAEGEDDE